MLVTSQPGGYYKTNQTSRLCGPKVPLRGVAVAVDLTGGLDASSEYFFPACPTEVGMRESLSMWISDDRGELGIPRVGIEAMSPHWDSHVVQLNIAFPDGRVYRVREQGKAVAAEGPDGTPSVLGAGPLAFRCMEPFRLWTATFEGTAIETSTEAQIAGRRNEGRPVDVEFHIEATMAVPAWAQGGLSTEAAALIESSDEARIVQGRYEQLFRAKGALRIKDEEYHFNGTGTRVRRRGIRPLHVFRGNILQSALFPSGRAFACIVHAPRTDGIPAYNEGYLFEGDGSLIPARVVEAPWMTRLKPVGEDMTVVFESHLGTTKIEGETVLSTFDLSRRPWLGPNFPVLYQGGVRYSWDGEETYGMIENTIPTMSDIDPSPEPIDPEAARTKEARLGGWTSA
jgi:hypothetical protein